MLLPRMIRWQEARGKNGKCNDESSDESDENSDDNDSDESDNGIVDYGIEDYTLVKSPRKKCILFLFLVAFYPAFLS